MTNEGEALFAAVCEQPWDDGVRLVYADWLEEHGQPERAAFIRSQCEYPNWDGSHPKWAMLSARDSEFDPFKPAWMKELPSLPGVKWWPDWFKRGFITTVTFASAKAFAEHAATVFAASPVDSLEVRRLTARTVSAVLASPFLGRLRRLHLDGGLGDEGVRLVGACPNLSRLDSLLLWGECGDAGAEAVAECPYLGALRGLSFSGHRISDRGALALAESPRLKRVTDLVLHGTRGLSPAVVRQLKKRFRRLI